ncbi:Uma2 family endonuclease [Paludisphaera mucosa]|uniref:Uma2 family endonuclease n=1 Tax=Paludisphaera mucosa TaxID=3030827 RepID=A0ABT6FDU2_9BACT|nr:Uma2 family endonuclease [Paludisphaera mucosa]MDG3005563.1 Uma2 family endonuclease [Paludisphaera mucosa]
MSVTAERISTEGRRLVLHGVPWAHYETLLDMFAERGVRMAFDRGTLELMTPLPIHERYKSLFTRMIETLADELDVDYFSLGSTTFSSRALERGVEPDACFLIASAGRVADWRSYDPAADPPPDLAVEIDVTSDSRRRLGIYAALKVPEAWRFDGTELVVWTLQGEQYVSAPHSPTFPTAAIGRLAQFVRDYRSGTDRTWIKAFRRWVREDVAPRGEG